VTKTQVDRLGNRLKQNLATEDDLRVLHEFRRSFSTAYQQVIATLTDELMMQPTGRPSKSTSSIIDKLKRESIRLSQMQDIAGCRLIVPDIIQQDQTLENLLRVFPEADVMDRRTVPSHGYRAVHVVVDVQERRIEIQLRTLLQQRWAELSEKLADAYGSAVKYGTGNETVLLILAELSKIVARFEQTEASRLPTHARAEAIELLRDSKEHLSRRIEGMIAMIASKMFNTDPEEDG
jgi:ppGpp synthetase/RelA/SpoT-type nucleotidyltranferase